MNGWFFYENKDNPFIRGNPFDTQVTDVVMVNAYSNVDEYFPDFVEETLSIAKKKLKEKDNKVKIFAALGAWSEPPLWKKPSIEHLGHDVDAIRKVGEVESYGFFKYGARGSEWYMPESAPEVWTFISKLQR